MSAKTSLTSTAKTFSLVEIHHFIKSNLRKKLPDYSTRMERNQCCADLLSNFSINSTVLNIGAGQDGHLKKIMRGRNADTLDVDFSIGAELSLNLDAINRLPFTDGEFEAVVSLDCLEHIENLNQIFSELVRCANKLVIVSLPIGPYEVVRSLLRPQKSSRLNNSEGVFSKYYGLPTERVLDRHRWFLWAEDIARLAMQLNEQNSKVVNVKLMTRSEDRLIPNCLSRCNYSLGLNLFSPSLWMLIEVDG